MWPSWLNPTYKIGFTYVKSDSPIHTTVALHDTGAGAKLILSALIPPERKNSANKEAVPKLSLALKQPLQLEALVRLHLLCGDLCTCAFFGIAPQFAVSILLLGISFIDRSIHEIFPSKINNLYRGTRHK